MVDFKSSLQQGLEAAKQAQKNRAEVDAVFFDLNAQIGEAFNQKVEIIRSHTIEYPSSNSIVGLANILVDTAKHVQILIARSKSDSKFTKELAKWSQDPYGYPCKIATREDEIHCEDRRALEEGLADLLRSSSAGEQILMILNHVPDTK